MDCCIFSTNSIKFSTDDILYKTVGLDPDLLILTVDTTITGQTASDTITIPMTGTADIHWGDGDSDLAVTGTQTHTYATGGEYQISISNTFGMLVYDQVNDCKKLTRVVQWGTNVWTDLIDAFWGCSNVRMLTSDLPNFSNVVSAQFAFRGCSSVVRFPFFDTSNIVNFSSMFRECIDNETMPLFNLHKMTSGRNMFTDCAIGTSDWSAFIIDVEANNPNDNVEWGGGTDMYNLAAAPARQRLIDRGWIITDGGLEP